MQHEPTGMCACGCGTTWPIPHYAVDENGCWVWQRATFDGYGTVGIGGKTFRAHRHFYEVYVGPIPEGLVIDHLCRNRACVNPAHMEPVTVAENSRRGERVALKTHCANGHLYTPENIMLKKNGGRYVRTCHLCKLESSRRYERAKRERRATEFSDTSNTTKDPSDDERRH